MKRKINQVGAGTLTVSLPAAWAKSRGLKKGDEIDIDEQGDALLIGGNVRTERKVATLHVTKENWLFLRSVIGGMYRNGIDEVHVTVESPELMLEVQKATAGGLAYEFFQKNEKTAIVKNIVTEFKIDLPQIIQKMRHVLSTIHQLYVDAAKSGVWDQYDYLSTLRHSLLNYRNLIGRMVGQRCDSGVIPYYNISFYMATMGGQYRYIYNWQKEHPGKHVPQDVQLLIAVGDYLNETVARSKPKLEIHGRSYTLSDEVLKEMQNPKANKQTLALVLMLARLIQNMNSGFLMLEQ